MLPIHEKILTLLKEIDSICHKYNIKWFIMYGTLLGAVRHQGFIPWDDDADIVMTYDNWIKFKDAFFNEHYPNRELRAIDIDSSEFGRTFAHYTDTSQEVIAKYNTVFREKSGISVDIFILDNFPDDASLQNKYIKNLIELNDIVHRVYCPGRYIPGKTSYFKKVFKYFLCSRKKVLDAYVKALSSIGDANSECYMQRTYTNWIYKKDILNDTVLIKFEDALFPAPKLFYELLHQHYGSQWMLIPSDKVVHDSRIISDNRGKEPLVRVFHSRKNRIIQNITYKILKLIDLYYLYKHRDWQLECRNIISSYILLVKNDKDAYIENFLAVQLSPWFIGRLSSSPWYNWHNYSKPYVISHDVNLLKKSIHFLINNDNLQMADFLMHGILLEKGLNKNFSEEFSLSKIIKEAEAALFYKNIDLAINLSRDALKSWPTNIQLWRIYIAAQTILEPDGDSLPATLPRRIQKDPEIALSRARIAWSKGQIGSMLRFLRSCACGTRNVLILRQLLNWGTEIQTKIQEILPYRKDILFSMKEIIYKTNHTLGNNNAAEESDLHLLPSFYPYMTATDRIIQERSHQAVLTLKKQFTLLQEVAQLCERSGVRYYLFGDALRFMASNESLQAQNIRLSIAIDGRECRKLLRFYKQHIKSNRFLESPLSNPDFPEFALYYGDINSLDLDVTTYGFRKQHGMYIEIKVLPVAYKCRWKNFLRIWLESTWNMEHGMLPATIGRLAMHTILACLRIIVGKKRVARWIFYNLFMKGKRLYNVKDNYQIFWNKKFILIPTQWFSGSCEGQLEGALFPVPRSSFQISLLKKLYGTSWHASNLPQQTSIEPFRIVDSAYSYENFFSSLNSSSFDINELWRMRMQILRLTWIRAFFKRKFMRDWNFLLFLNERYRMYTAVLPLKKKILYYLSRGKIDRFNALMESSAMKNCLNKTERYLRQGLCFNFDAEMFNVVVEYFRSKKKISVVKKLLVLNKKQKYPKIK